MSSSTTIVQALAGRRALVSSYLSKMSLIVPAGILYCFMFVLPVTTFLEVSVYAPSTTGFSGDQFTFENYIKIFSDSFYLNTALTTLRISALVTTLAIVAGYVAAYSLTMISPAKAKLLVSLLILPLMISTIVRVYGWMVILSPKGVVNNFLLSMSVVEAPVTLLYTETATVVGLTTILLPYSVVALAAVLLNLDPTLKEAAVIHGATRFQTFLKVTLPLSRPGIVSAFALVFTLCMSTYMISLLLGGPSVKMLGNLIFDSTSALNWPMAASLSAVLLVVTIVTVILVMSVLSAVKRGRRVSS